MLSEIQQTNWVQAEIQQIVFVTSLLFVVFTSEHEQPQYMILNISRQR